MGISTLSDPENLSNFDNIFTSQFLKGRETSTVGLYLLDKNKFPGDFFDSPLSRAYICEGRGGELAFAGIIEGNNFIFILKSHLRNPDDNIFYLKKDKFSLLELEKLLKSIIKPIDYMDDNDQFNSQSFEIIGAQGINISFLEKKIQFVIQNNPSTKGCFIPSDNSRGKITALEDISKSWDSALLKQTMISRVERVGF